MYNRFFTNKSLLSLQRGQSPAIFHGEHSDGNGYCAREHCTAFGAPTEIVKADDVDDTACKAASGVNLLAEDEGHLVDKNVAQHTAAGTSDNAEADGCPRGHAQSEGLLDADYVEERETYAVEKEPRIILSHKPFAEYDYPHEAKQTSEQIDGVLEPEWSLADEQVASRSATDSRGCAHDEGAEEVEVLGRREAGT